MFQKLKTLTLVLLAVPFFSVYAADMAAADQSEARDYALQMLYEHIGEKRQLSEAELMAVEQIVHIYQDIETRLEQRPEPQLPKETPSDVSGGASFDVLAKRLLGLRAEFYEYFLNKNFGTTDDPPAPQAVSEKTAAEESKQDE